eukprot:TRINITY_DN32153_c0_g1_i1.p1 TRINITY_DN32153_c0_g1~~TRINITY_DN32153_c0_g1_i1.p1  ORF type:complete len:505 (+),score=158.58 TRINITY_DN32153_c0_g1_i1:81-1595(+)
MLSAAVICSAVAGGGLTARQSLSSDIPSAATLVKNRGAGVAPLGHAVTVKFVDGAGVRAGASGRLESARSSTAAAEKIASRYGASFRSVFGSVPGLAALQHRAERTSGRAQPDLMAVLRVDFDAAATDEALVSAARDFDTLPEVEYVTVSPVGTEPPQSHHHRHCHRCVSCHGTMSRNVSHLSTPDFVSRQTYRNADPGMDVDWAEANVAGWPEGGGVRWSDIEYSWYYEHEDMAELTRESGVTEVGNFRDHGTASAGIAVGVRNGFGITGVAAKATAQTFSEQTVEHGHNRPRAIAAAAAASRAGDVILYEMQTTCLGSVNYVPAECDNSVWLATRTAADAGVVVVAAAGNGNADLDSSTYSSYMSRGDSGAIIVGAGEAKASHPKASFSTYGSRVDVHGWGDWSVMTTGYGDCRFDTGLPYGEARYYTGTFSGTSSASALVSSAVAAIQSYVVASTGSPMSPEDMRDLLKATGVAQGAGGHIGPHVNVKHAVEALQVSLQYN